MNKDVVDVQVGQEIYIRDSIQFSYRRYKNFWRKTEIDRLTKTQIIIVHNGNIRRFRRKDFSEVSGYGTNIGFIGDVVQYETIRDQEDEYLEYKKRVDTVTTINNHTNFYVSSELNIPTDDLVNIAKTLVDAKQKIDAAKKEFREK